MESTSRPWSLPFALAVVLLPGCAERTLGDASPSAASFPAGQIYGECDTVADCTRGTHCLHPEGSRGYCTDDCRSREDCPSEDDPALDVECLPAVPEAGPVCVLSCATLSCPDGMRCEAVALVDGAHELCF